MKQLALPPATSRKNYYVSFYMNDISHENRRLFTAFYGRDYESEHEAKRAAIKCFISRSGGLDFYNIVTLTEHNGTQIADQNEPYRSKSAIVRQLAIKTVPCTQ